MCNDNDKLDKIEEKLILEEQKSKKEEMPVSGKSVFEIERIKDKKKSRTEGEYRE